MGDVIEAKTLDEKGRCCGRKPIRYRRPDRFFCPRCDAKFGIDGRQQPNWAYECCGDRHFRKVASNG